MPDHRTTPIATTNDILESMGHMRFHIVMELAPLAAFRKRRCLQLSARTFAPKPVQHP